MSVDYNNFAEKFAHSRKEMVWEELKYFFEFGEGNESLLDVACGSGRLLEQYREHFGYFPKAYLGLDLSSELLKEALKNFPEHQFLEGNMLSTSQIIGRFIPDFIYCIAGFHHLETRQERIQTLQEWYKILPAGGKVFLTNWALESPLNFEKYKAYKIQGTESHDFLIPFGKYTRYYHCFRLDELESLATESGFNVQENRVFDTQKNFVTILKK